MADDPHNRTKPIQSGRSDKDGVFVISDVTGEVLLSYSPPAPYLGRIQARYEIQPDDKSPKEIRLEYRGGIRVRAVDAETGKEVTHYNVRISYAEDHDSSGFTRGYSYGFPSELARGVNIAAGGTEFRMDDQRIGAPYMVNVTAAGYIPAKVPRVVSVKSDEAQITVVPMYRASPHNSMIVTGTLRDDNKAVANAKVCLVSSSKPEEIISWHNLKNDFFKNQPECIQFLETTSDSEGKFQFTNVLRSTDTVEIYYFHPQGDQRFRNLKLDQSKSEHNFDLVASPMVTLLLRIDPQHYPEARYVSIALPFRENDAPPLPIAFEGTRIQFSQFSGREPIRVKLPPGEYRVEVVGKFIPSNDGNFGTSQILARRKLTLSEEESGILLDL